ncbi:MAG: OmpA family protein [Acidobacteria bacterium]|nr:OmpA family protein [Acidobacteriota bacterium]
MNRNFSQLSLLLFVLLISVLISACAPPTAKVKVSRNEIKAGEPVTVSWETKNAKSIELNGQNVEKLGAKSFNPKDTTTYEIVAKRGKKLARDRALVKVEIVKPPAPTAMLSADPSAIERGQTTKLKWATENAKIITIEGIGEVAATGERQVGPSVSTTYTLTGTGDGGSANASARVTVTDPPPPPVVADRPRTTKPEEPSIADQFRNVMKPIYFDYNKSELKKSEEDKLRRIADWLNQDRNRTIAFRAEGNCDPRGTAEYNLGLGDRRARTVKDFLTSLGVDPTRIETVSYGLEKAQGTDEGSPEVVPSWAHDRRADFIYLRGGDRP